MNLALDRPTIDQASQVIETAEKALADLCSGRRRFSMSIPVQEDDFDIQIGNALYIARQLLKEHDAGYRTCSECTRILPDIGFEDGVCLDCRH